MVEQLLVPQSRFGDKVLGNLDGLSPKRDCSSKRVNTIILRSISIKTYLAPGTIPVHSVYPHPHINSLTKESVVTQKKGAGALGRSEKRKKTKIRLPQNTRDEESAHELKPMGKLNQHGHGYILSTII